jgi:hypothetical protein
MKSSKFVRHNRNLGMKHREPELERPPPGWGLEESWYNRRITAQKQNIADNMQFQPQMDGWKVNP